MSDCTTSPPEVDFVSGMRSDEVAFDEAMWRRWCLALRRPWRRCVPDVSAESVPATPMLSRIPALMLLRMLRRLRRLPFVFMVLSPFCMPLSRVRPVGAVVVPLVLPGAVVLPGRAVVSVADPVFCARAGAAPNVNATVSPRAQLLISPNLIFPSHLAAPIDAP